jgi:hypothetical protein
MILGGREQANAFFQTGLYPNPGFRSDRRQAGSYRFARSVHRSFRRDAVIAPE